MEKASLSEYKTDEVCRTTIRELKVLARQFQKPCSVDYHVFEIISQNSMAEM